MPAFQAVSPVPQVVRVESDAAEIGRNESELGRAHANNADDDAIHPRYDPALPPLLSEKNRRQDC